MVWQKWGILITCGTFKHTFFKIYIASRGALLIVEILWNVLYSIFLLFCVTKWDILITRGTYKHNFFLNFTLFFLHLVLQVTLLESLHYFQYYLIMLVSKSYMYISLRALLLRLTIKWAALKTWNYY